MFAVRLEPLPLHSDTLSKLVELFYRICCEVRPPAYSAPDLCWDPEVVYIHGQPSSLLSHQMPDEAIFVKGGTDVTPSTLDWMSRSEDPQSDLVVIPPCDVCEPELDNVCLVSTRDVYNLTL
jgi:hypothetical protein